mgnify:FL=1
MLQSLHIQNYAIIEKLELNLNNGFTVITGETGAGKSILLGALGLIMGNRADTAVLQNKEQKCIVEAIYNIHEYPIHYIFEEEGLDYEPVCIIRREINPQGKSRAFINDTPVTLDVLRKINPYLVDLHQQFDSLEIHAEDFQIQILDALAGNLDRVKEYQKHYLDYRNTLKKLNELNQQNIEAAKEADFLRFQLSELEDLQLREGEGLELEEEYNRLNGSEEIRVAGNALIHGIDESEYSIVSRLLEMIKQMESISDVDRMAHELLDRLFSVKEELLDISGTATRMVERAESDPQRLIWLENRLNQINRLINKHRVQHTEDLLLLIKDMSNQLNKFTNLEEEIEKISKRVVNKESELKRLGELLNQGRRDKVQVLESKVHEVLSQMAMINAHLQINIENTDQWKPNGKNRVEFLFSANKGLSPLPLHKVASGGEISRLNLAIKSIVADAVTLPTLIFDEIDTGISGHVALKMGHILKSLAQKHQTIVITHSPQIASQADHHFYIYKREDANKATTLLKVLNEEERIYEIAKMLSSDPPSNEAISNAQMLMV